MLNKSLSLAIISTSLFISFSSIATDSQQDEPLAQSKIRGENIYMANCVACHQVNGEGVVDIFPPLAKADYLMEDDQRSITEIINGMSGEIIVNGKMYNNVMPAFELSDQEVADVLNYIRNSWGNEGEAITGKQVALMR